MNLNFLRKIKILLFIIILIAFFVFFIIWQKYPFGVKEYKTVFLGMLAEEGPGSHTIWAPPHDVIPKDANFLYIHLEMKQCAFSLIVAQEDHL